MHSRLSLCIFVSAVQIAQSLTQLLSSDRYCLHQVHSLSELSDFVTDYSEQIDCLIVLNEPSILPLFNQLYEQVTLLPAIVIEPAPSNYNIKEGTFHSQEHSQKTNSSTEATYLYHSGEVRLRATELEKINIFIDRAITQFLHLGSSCTISKPAVTSNKLDKVENQQNLLMLQQHRLAEKLKERLGYLGVYYKRSPQQFYRNLPGEEKKQLLEQLNADYRQIILSYFVQDTQINQIIDQFVNGAFFADISASQILEIHMELMDEFAQQLKLEGRNEDILLDYRLALIDILAHLGEMYRRSIPREDIPFDLLYQID
ncbi:MAG: circadian clock protein KaiA [Microcystaceae cyanobacterium]